MGLGELVMTSIWQNSLISSILVARGIYIYMYVCIPYTHVFIVFYIYKQSLSEGTFQQFTEKLCSSPQVQHVTWKRGAWFWRRCRWTRGQDVDPSSPLLRSHVHGAPGDQTRVGCLGCLCCGEINLPTLVDFSLSELWGLTWLSDVKP